MIIVAKETRNRERRLVEGGWYRGLDRARARLLSEREREREREGEGIRRGEEVPLGSRENLQVNEVSRGNLPSSVVIHRD